ncbi:MAG: IS91 family transposase [Syntrophobacteraceae bacterium]
MQELADVFRRHGPEYRSKFTDRMPSSHLKAMADIENCRTESMGGHLYLCDQCAEIRYSYHSCKNRHCPKCGNDTTDLWLKTQIELLLPENYFLITFTLPAGLRHLARSNQKLIYDLLFTASAEALKKLAMDPKFLGGRIAMIGVLHTWGRDLSYHPHVHYIVPGGCLSSDNRWLPCGKKFFVPVKALSIIFRAKIRDGLQKLGLLGSVDQKIWISPWIVHSKPVGTGKAALRYLAPYVYRVALSNNRIEHTGDTSVTFHYRESDSGTLRRMILTPVEFIRRFLQHVLPDGFHKVRYYGLLSPSNRKTFKLLQNILTTGSVLEAILNPAESEKPSELQRHETLFCPHCGSTLRLIKTIRAAPTRGPP